MVFEMKRGFCCCLIMLLVLFLPSARLNAQDGFEGIYTSLRVGTFLDHSRRGRITVEDLEPRARSVRSQLGLETAFALGIWLRISDVRMRSEFEVGYNRAQLEARSRPTGLRGDEGRGYKDGVLFLWSNYWNFLSRGSRHQPWAGFGIGGASQRRRFYFLRLYKEDFETDFVLTGTIGYDYRLTDQLGVGVHYRYVHIFDQASASGQSQLRLGLIYGF